MSKSSKIAVLALVLWFGVAFLVPKLLGVRGPNLWILFAGLSIIGVLAAGAYIWLEMRNAAAERAADQPREGDSGDELSQSLREAENKLRSSNLGKNAKFGNLSVVFIIGPQGSTKTTTMIHSGLNPELLAGQIYQDNSGNAVAPTRFANIWFARQSVFLEPASKVMEDAGKWSRLIRRLRPGQLASAVGKGVQAPRAAVVVFDCEEFLKPRAAEAVAGAVRNLHDKLGDISKTMGISLPVYAMFTKGDRLPFFHDYFHTLTNEEATQVLGATLPVTASGRSAYDQEETARLNAALDELYFSLARRRTDFLAREGDAERLPGIYEFPREFQKVRTLLANFMLDLCRPSQLNAAPFLRGFYFSGVRPILVRDAAPAPVVADARTFKPEGGATGVFRVAEEAAGARASADVSPPRRVPQWIFLRNFFSQVLLADDAALAASAVSVKTSLLRRVLLGSAMAILLLLSVAFIVSFSRNWSLVSGSREAAAGIVSRDVSAAVPSIPSLDDLTKLDALRQSLETISRYNRDGAPLSYRWGLYIGNELYPKLRRVYFGRFWQLLFVSTQLGLIANLQTLPASPSPTDSYQYPYDSLKAYLITTSNHDKSTLAYLSPLLLTRWAAGKSVDSARAQLARKQFDFYSEELRYENPFPSENDSAAVARARKYLAQFAGTERVYRFMQAEVNKTAPSLNFNQKFPGSAQTVVNNREMAGAFTKAGWPLMLDAIKHAERYFNGEQWVLGDQSANIGDRAKLEQDLRQIYTADYADQWRDYLKKSVVVSYSNIPDAAKKLTMTASPQSPLLAMFCLASQNVGVDTEIAKSFKALLAVVPSACTEQYVGQTNQEYMKSLLALQLSLSQITGSADPNDPAVTQAASQAAAAKVVTGGMAQGFGVDPLGVTVRKLIEDPITDVERYLKGLGPAALNKGGQSLCTEFRGLMTKYPFNSQSPTDASLEEVSGIFKPAEGSLWKFWGQSLQKLLPKQGATYVSTPTGGVTVTPAFVSFFNQAAAFSNALYSGSADPHFTYSLRPAPSEGIQSVTLNIDGQTLTYAGGTAAAKQLNWPGAPAGVRATAKFGGSTDITWATYPGLWSVFRFFGRAEKPVGAGASSSLEWVIRIGDQPATLPNGKPLTVRFDLDMGASPPVFQKSYFSTMRCVAEVAK